MLKRDHRAKCHLQSASSENKSHAIYSDDLQRQLIDLHRLVSMLPGNQVRVEEVHWDAEDEMDELQVIPEDEMDELEEDYVP